MKVYVLKICPWGEQTQIEGVYPNLESLEKQVNYLTDENGEGYDPSDLRFEQFEMEI